MQVYPKQKSPHPSPEQCKAWRTTNDAAYRHLTTRSSTFNPDHNLLQWAGLLIQFIHLATDKFLGNV